MLFHCAFDHQPFLSESDQSMGPEILFHNPSFKRCPSCGETWGSQACFLEDPNITLIGYQAHFEELKQGLFHFSHSCHATVAISVKTFENLHSEERFGVNRAGGKECPQHCLYRDNLDPCPVPCGCSWVRELLQTIRVWPKNLRRPISDPSLASA